MIREKICDLWYVFFNTAELIIWHRSEWFINTVCSWSVPSSSIHCAYSCSVVRFLLPWKCHGAVTWPWHLLKLLAFRVSKEKKKKHLPYAPYNIVQYNKKGANSPYGPWHIVGYNKENKSTNSPTLPTSYLLQKSSFSKKRFCLQHSTWWLSSLWP